MRIKLLFVLLTVHLLHAEYEYTLENSNISVTQDKNPNYNYNRLRYRSDYTTGDYFTTFIADHVHYFDHDFVTSSTFNTLKDIKADTRVSTQTAFSDTTDSSNYFKLYRFFTGYEDDKYRVVIGLQNISMGVGRIWTPSNIFNPRNSLALEPDEIFGVMALSYTRHLNDTSKLTLVSSEKEDKSYKYAAQLKSFINEMDMAIDIISSDTTQMLAFELEGHLGDTGVEIRSEATYIDSTFLTLTGNKNRDFYQGIVGFDYGFVAGLTLTVEAFLSSHSFSQSEILLNYDSEISSNLVSSKYYLATNFSYAFNLILSGSLTYIESFNESNSRFISPTLVYAYNDYNTFTFGAMILDGPEDSEYGAYSNRYFLKYGLAF